MPPSPFSPLTKEVQAVTPPAGAAVAQDYPIGQVPFNGQLPPIIGLRPRAAVTGQDTDYRTLRVLLYHGPMSPLAGQGPTLVGIRTMDADFGALPKYAASGIQVGDSDRNVYRGDLLVLEETVTGAGLASPGFSIGAELTRGIPTEDEDAG